MNVKQESMRTLNKTFDEMTMQRIYDLEAKKQDHLDWKTRELKFAELQRKISSTLEEIGLGSEFKELITLQAEETYDMYCSVYRRGFADAIMISYSADM